MRHKIEKLADILVKAHALKPLFKKQTVDVIALSVQLGRLGFEPADVHLAMDLTDHYIKLKLTTKRIPFKEYLFEGINNNLKVVGCA